MHLLIVLLRVYHYKIVSLKKYQNHIIKYARKWFLQEQQNEISQVKYYLLTQNVMVTLKKD